VFKWLKVQQGQLTDISIQLPLKCTCF